MLLDTLEEPKADLEDEMVLKKSVQEADDGLRVVVQSCAGTQHVAEREIYKDLSRQLV